MENHDTRGKFIAIAAASGLFAVTIADYIRIAGVKPDFFLLCVVLVSLLYETEWPFAIGISLGMGFLQDTFSGSRGSLNTFLLPVWSLFILQLSRKITLERVGIRICLIAVVTLVHALVTRAFSASFGNCIPWGTTLRIICTGSVYNAFVLFLFFRYINPLSLRASVR